MTSEQSEQREQARTSGSEAAAAGDAAPPSVLSAREMMRLSYGAQMSGVGLVVGGATGILQSANEDYRSVSARPSQPRDRAKLNARAARRGLLLGGKYAGFVAGLVGCEIALGRYRDRDDAWNLVGAGAVTGGAFCVRGGAAAGIAGATMGAALCYLVGTGLSGLEALSATLEVEAPEKAGAGVGSMPFEEETSGIQNDDTDGMAKQIEHMEATLKHWPKPSSLPTPKK